MQAAAGEKRAEALDAIVAKGAKAGIKVEAAKVALVINAQVHAYACTCGMRCSGRGRKVDDHAQV